MNWYSLPPLLTLVCFLGLAVHSAGSGRKGRIERLFALICTFGCFLYIDTLLAFHLTSAEAALWISRIDHVFVVFIPPLYIHFFHAFLGIANRKKSTAAAYFFSAAMLPLVFSDVFIESVHRHAYGYFANGGTAYAVFAVFAFAANVYVLGLVIRAIGSEKDSIRKNRLWYVLIGFCGMGMLNGLSILPILRLSDGYPPGGFSFVPLLILYVGLFRHNIFDLGRLIRKGLICFLPAALISAVWIAGFYSDEGLNLHENWIWFIIGFLFVAVVVGPVNERLSLAIDRSIFTEQYNYQETLKRLSRSIVSCREASDIIEQTRKTVSESMNVGHLEMLFIDHRIDTDMLETDVRYVSLNNPDLVIEKDSPLVRQGEKSQRPMVRKQLMGRRRYENQKEMLSAMERIGASVILLLPANGDIRGLVVLGEKASGRLYSKEDLDLLETLANQVALALENAHAYQRLKDYQDNLQQLVEERSRKLNKTILEKEKAQEQLIRSESLAAIGQLVAGTAHEMNNPVAAALSLVQSTIEDLENWNPADLPEEALIEDLKFVVVQLNRVRAIVSSLLSVSRQTQTYEEPVQLNALVEDSVRVLENEMKHKDIRLVRHLDWNLPEIKGNFAHLGQVVINIVKNAIQAIENGCGRIDLQTIYDRSKQQAVFICRDTGAGVPPEIRNRIFQPFYTTKPVGEGTGLGLYISHEIIRKHGGNILVGGNDHLGAEVIVRLPAMGPP